MKHSRIAIYIILFATLLKFSFLFFVSGIQVWEDHDIALNFIATGEQFCDSDGARFFAYQFPVYPFLIACMYKLFGVYPVAAIALNIFLNGCAALILYLFILDFIQYFLKTSPLARYRDKIALAAVLIFLLHHAINYYVLYNVHPFALDSLLLFMCLWRMMRFVLNPVFKNLVLYAVVLGFTMLDRTSLVVVLFPLLILALRDFGFRKTAGFFSVIVLLSSLIVLPWLIRNYYKEGIVGFESSIAKDLWKGSMREGEGSSYLTSGKNYYPSLSSEEIHGLGKMSSKQQYNFFSDKYLDILINDPKHVCKMYFVKLKNFWLFRDRIGSDYSADLRTLLPFYKIFYLCVLLFSVLSLFIVRGSLILFSVPFFLSLLQSVFYVETRHRMIIEPLLIFLAILAITQLWLRFFKKRAIVN